MYTAFAEGGYAGTASEMFSEDVVWHLPGRGPLAGDHRGRQAVLAAMRGFEELSGGTIRVELHGLLADDEHGVVLLRATGRRQGKQYESLEIDVHHIRDGRITEFWSFSEDQGETDEFWS